MTHEAKAVDLRGGESAEKGGGAEKTPTGAKALNDLNDLRGPEGPLFHGCAHTPDFFSKL